MKITEIISEAKDIPADPKKLDGAQVASLKGAVSIPDISNNKSNGSAYLQYRFGIALGGAGAGSTPSEHTDPAGAFSGDPVMLTYTDEEGEMINNAAKMVGVGQVIPLGSRKSLERDDVHKVSPMTPRGPIKPKRRK